MITSAAILLALNLFQMPVQGVDPRPFVKEMNPFIRALWGCPGGKDASDPSLCHPAEGTFDARAFERARAEAAKLFDLRYPKEGKKKGPKKK